MKYRDLLNAYVALKKPLLIKSVVEINTKDWSEKDIRIYLSDYRFYNQSLTDDQNLSVKLNVKNERGISAEIVCGGIFIRTIVYPKSILTEDMRSFKYEAGGLLIKDADFFYHYKFNKDSYKKITCSGKKIIYTQNLKYNVHARISRLLTFDPVIKLLGEAAYGINFTTVGLGDKYNIHMKQDKIYESNKLLSIIQEEGLDVTSDKGGITIWIK